MPNIINAICDFPQTPAFPLVFFITFLILTLVVTTLTIIVTHKLHKDLVFTIICAVIFYPLALISGTVMAFLIIILNQGDSRLTNPSQPAHIVNAAIKNTCYLDPLRRNCPTNLDQLKIIIPQDIQSDPSIQNVSYTYYPFEHQYTLIFKTAPNFYAIFDPLLQPYHEHGFDFMGIIQYRCSKEIHPYTYSTKPGVLFSDYINERNLQNILPR